MEPEKNQGTDARSIKPVSSLLSHFEALKPHQISHASSSRHTDHSPLPVRASFDLPRPDSPWNAKNEPSRGGAPQTPVKSQQRERSSPTRSGHRRPMSMHLGSSPQLTPAVNVESPKSPPRTFFGRSLSRSPERMNNTPIGKVKELISANSSRPSTRPPSPGADGENTSRRGSSGKTGSVGASSGARPVSPTRPPPPPVNRADKPKIPAKPLNIISQVPTSTGRLTPEPSLISGERVIGGRVSPFSTPPSSEGSPSPDEQNAPQFAADKFGNIPEETGMRPGDPRLMGFNAAGVPVRANTLAERKIPRNPSPPKRYVSDEIQQPNPQTRDARQFGFSSNTPITPVREERPELPTRRAVLAPPPPRPSEQSKNAAPRKQSPQTTTERSKQPLIPQNSKSMSVPTPSDTHFPPPPKRNTFNDDEEHKPIPSKSNTAPPSEKAAPSYHDAGHDSDEAEKSQEPNTIRTDYPDATQTNRRPPFNMSGIYEIKSKSDGRVFDVCRKYLCVSGYVTRVFDMSSGEQILGVNHGETVKFSSVRFKPGTTMFNEGERLWLGNNIGELQEIDLLTHSVVASSLAHNRRDIIRILRHRQNMWTLDDDGKLFVWRADESGVPNLKYSHTAHKVPKGHTFSMVVQDKLWHATGKEVRVYRPGNEANFSVLAKSLTQLNCGDVTSGTYSGDRGRKVYLGHTDGKVSLYSTSDYSCVGVVKASDYKISGLSFVGDRLWAAYKTGKVYVYDTSCTPWKVKKDWHAHAGPVSGLALDPSSVWSLSRLQVVTSGHDDMVRLWDATLEEDWMEAAMHEKDVDYCSFREVRAAVVSWNVGAVVPSMVNNDFIADAIHSDDPPEILVFGFQEVVDLEDKATTAKSLLGFAKKKDTAKAEQHQSRVYRDWRDYLARCIGRFTSAQYAYTELQTSSLIGLFQCVFIRQDQRKRISSVNSVSVKCGMGGHYGNKGALVTRFVLDDSSICFINCHLAAGQTQTSHRNNDVATILESESLPVESNRQLRSFLFIGGGDGSQILDHEICILNGDLNYRIDAIPRDTVISMIRRNEFSKLLERDQIMVCRRRIAGFRLASFTELPITFAPTYKYDVGTDNYDSSDKKRSPAWCDRLLYRGPGRVKQVEYRRHDGVRVSDHRPVSGVFKIRVKRVDVDRQEKVRQDCFRKFQAVKKQMCEAVCIKWLVEVMGIGEKEAKHLIAS